LNSDVETQRISREEWGTFLEEFTEINEGTSCRVEVVGSPDLGTQVLLEERPLLAVSLEEDEDAPQVVIECGDPADDGPAAFRRLLPAPTAIWGRKREPHGWDALEIESAECGAVILTIDPHPAQ